MIKYRDKYLTMFIVINEDGTCEHKYNQFIWKRGDEWTKRFNSKSELTVRC